MSASISERRTRIIEAATAVFLRYGFAKTTMVDVAKAARLTRPTLYQEFPDKESVFHAVVDHMVATKLAEIRAGLASRMTLEAKLGFACDAWGSEGFDMVLGHPDAADMFELGFASVCRGYEGFGTLVEEILREPVAQSRSAQSSHELARMIVYAIKGFKDIAKDGADIRRLIATLVALVAAVLALGPICEPLSERSQ